MFEKIDHMGIAVHSLEKALKMYEEVYGLHPLKIQTLEDIHVRIAFIPLGEVLIELLEPTEEGAGRIGKFLQEQGEGFHHIAFRVKDIDAALSRLKETGARLRDEQPRPGGDDSRIAFIDPSFTQNVLTELVERKREVTGD
ncbi:MAG: methylmalonyl-CoA epimerase [Desulfomonile tiedjei]|nr:methylmalonyl-CoA epimerase [Desulfomonile tiedjei]